MYWVMLLYTLAVWQGCILLNYFKSLLKYLSHVCVVNLFVAVSMDLSRVTFDKMFVRLILDVLKCTLLLINAV